MSKQRTCIIGTVLMRPLCININTIPVRLSMTGNCLLGVEMIISMRFNPEALAGEAMVQESPMGVILKVDASEVKPFGMCRR